MALGRIILASQSPRRGLLLGEAGLAFEQCNPPFADPASPSEEQGTDAGALACRLAVSKAHSLWAVLAGGGVVQSTQGAQTGTKTPLDNESCNLPHQEEPRPGSAPVPAAAQRPYLIVGADTICVDTAGRLIGQPGTRPEAGAMIRRFTGVWHEVVTGVGLMDDQGRCVGFSDAARVCLEHLDDASLEHYLDSGQWQGKAGGYNLFDRQAAGWPIRVEGDPATVVGLPMAMLLPVLQCWQQSGDWEAAVSRCRPHIKLPAGGGPQSLGAHPQSSDNRPERRP